MLVNNSKNLYSNRSKCTKNENFFYKKETSPNQLDTKQQHHFWQFENLAICRSSCQRIAFYKLRAKNERNALEDLVLMAAIHLTFLSLKDHIIYIFVSPTY